MEKIRSKYTWLYPNKETVKTAVELSEAWGTNPVIAMLMLRRGLESRDDQRVFFTPKLEHLHDPYQMKDMDKAVARVLSAKRNDERIMIYGDYDVDGTTSVALLARYFKQFYPNFITYIPDRYKEGYGLSQQGIDYAIEHQCKLLIALDCGIKSVDLVAQAQERGLDIIICDHHTPGNTIPPAVAVLDPKRSDCLYPYKELSGCGVGFKLLEAIERKTGGNLREFLFAQLDLLALSVGADIVPITGENRVFAYYGMRQIIACPSEGVKALIKVSGRKIHTIDDVVFSVAPRINAAGRIEHGSLAVELLSTEDPQVAKELAEKVNLLNQQRRSLDKSITDEALTSIQNQIENDAPATVVWNDSWNKGVIGIVASRLIETFYRPTIVLTRSGDVYAGSARSVEGFDLYRALEACRENLIQFGGHMYAAGMTILPEKLHDFKKAFLAEVENTLLPEQKSPKISVDAVLPFEHIDDTLMNTLRRMRPFGPHNMKPVFVTRNLQITEQSKKVGADLTHLKVEFVDPTSGETIDAIAFGMGEYLDDLLQAEKIHVAYHLEENVWNNSVKKQLQVLDLSWG
jgi:single-stranded-DNA-specific exonuclease